MTLERRTELKRTGFKRRDPADPPKLARAELRRTEMPRARKRIRPVSEKREAQRDAYEEAKALVWRRDRGRCQAERLGVWPEVPCGGIVDPHHTWPQSQYPRLRCAPGAMKCVCRAHHNMIHHVDPTGARAARLLVREDGVF